MPIRQEVEFQLGGAVDYRRLKTQVAGVFVHIFRARIVAGYRAVIARQFEANTVVKIKAGQNTAGCAGQAQIVIGIQIAEIMAGAQPKTSLPSALGLGYANRTTNAYE